MKSTNIPQTISLPRVHIEHYRKFTSKGVIAIEGFA